ncbi:MAG: hypothetical protein M1827_006331 [Pycnora praestabilis]|nr:MAG: hypothetical protein M1827_006331 [Pycnora praestabilis]
MSQQQPPEHPLEVLPAMVNLVLLQTAKVFRDPAKHSSKNIIHTNAQMKTVVPGAVDRFHAALDEIEVEILRAKATMERDLALVRARRAEREREAAAERSRIAAEASAKEPSYMRYADESKDEKFTASEERTEDVDMVMMDEPQDSDKTEDEIRKESNEGLKAITQTEDAFSPAHGKATDPPPPLDLSILDAKQEIRGNENNGGKNKDGGDDNKEHDAPLEDETPATAGLKDMNFESMFADVSGEGGDNDLNFDLDFSGDGTGNENLLNDDPFGNNIGETAASALPGPSNEDVSSLLPGLESYANADDDFSMLELPPSSNAIDNAVGSAVNNLQTTQTAYGGSNGPTDLLPPDSSFDDLFFNSAEFNIGDGNVGSTGGDDSGMLGEGGEFDDAFFGLDGS